MRKLVFISIDGASWPVIDSLVKDGKLPTFKRLINNGVKKILYNINMINGDPWRTFDVYSEYKKSTPHMGVHHDVADWTTLATGVMPDKHRLITSTEKNIKGIELPTSKKKRKKPTIWEILVQYNKKIGIIGWVANWPPPPLFDYTVAKISDIIDFDFISKPRIKPNKYFSDRRNFLCNPTYPPWLWKELTQIDYDREVDRFIQRVPLAIRNLLIYDSLYLEWANYLLKRFIQPDFLAICIYELHNLSHIFWDCLKIERGNFRGIIHQRRQKKFGYIIEDYYQYLDRKINDILHLIDNNSIIMIASVHGMQSSRITKKYLLMNRIYKELGFLKFKNGKIDWNNTQVYDNQNWWGIFAIRKGFIKNKYPMRIFKYFKKSMEKIRTEKGEPLFLEINFNKKDNSFLVIPNYRAVHCSTKIFLNNNFLPVREFIRFRSHYSLHNPEGIFIVSAKNIKYSSINKSKITTLDIAPTIFYLLDIKYKDKDMKGKVILKEKRRRMHEKRINFERICNSQQ
jgi:predicted AlkP superfamily phosphohydrolase/phosphomutase